MNDCGKKSRLQHAALAGDQEFHAFRQAIHIRFERTQLVAQRFGQHRNHAVHEIRRVAAFARFHVQFTFRLHVVRHIRDVHPQFPTILRIAFQTNRIIEIFRVIRINRHNQMRTTIHATVKFIRRRLGQTRNRIRLVQHRSGKVQRQFVLAQHPSKMGAQSAFVQARKRKGIGTAGRGSGARQSRGPIAPRAPRPASL